MKILTTILLSLAMATTASGQFFSFFEDEQAENPAVSPVVLAGEELFAENCQVCHRIGQQIMGPSLAGITFKRPIPWLIRFIQNSQEVISSGDPYAVTLYKNYNYMNMPNFDYLSEEEITAILTYIESKSDNALSPRLWDDNR